MGKVTALIKAQNWEDISALAAGYTSDSPRTLEAEALIDTGSVYLYLKESYVRQLGLRPVREIFSTTMSNRKEKRTIYSPVDLEILGRTAQVSVVGVPDDLPNLVGQIPLESLDFLVDSRNQKLIPGHADGPLFEEYGESLAAPSVLPRDLEAVRIPSGDPITLKEGSPFTVTQALGASITLLYANAYMVRINSKDADAVGVKLEEIKPNTPTGPIEEKTVYDQLRKVFDPEIPVNIVDLGLVYDCQVGQMAGGAYRIDVKMTLTAPGCGMGPVIAQDAKTNILAIPGVDEANVELVWDPPWNQGMISEVGKMQLGMI